MSSYLSDVQGASKPPDIMRVESDEEYSLEVDIDLQALAEEVYNLLKRELRLEYERKGWQRAWK